MPTSPYGAGSSNTGTELGDGLETTNGMEYHSCVVSMKI